MQLPNQKEFTLPFHGRDLKFTVSDLAGQANAAVLGQYGDTLVLVTTVMGKEDRDTEFFPLTVDYEERFYAAGKVLGSRFIRREGRPSTDAVLSGRLIDRSIRPLFDSRLRRDVQVVITILSYDEENDPDFLALATASLALSISDIPWQGPIAGVRLMLDPLEKSRPEAAEAVPAAGRSLTGLDEDITVNPLVSKVKEVLQKQGTCDAFFSGTAKGSINMIELEGREITETDAEKLFASAQEETKKLIEFQKDIISKIGKEKASISLADHDPAIVAEVRAFTHDVLQKIVFIQDGAERDEKIAELKATLVEHLTQKELPTEPVSSILKEIINEIVHAQALENEKRPDGRGITAIRPLHAQVGLFKRLHGSSLFMRGATQSLAVTTLAAPVQEQLVETMESTMKRRFMLHYNFPPFSTGETGRMGSPGRREIGHGALAEKALRAVIP